MCIALIVVGRNVLVGNDGLSTVKLSDVGLSRTLAGSDYYRKVSNTKVPIKWMAPESVLERLYTSASDVWSFGVLCWEVYALGEAPYSQMRYHEIIIILDKGYRMPRPVLCPAEVYGDGLMVPRMTGCRYTMIEQCWSKEAGERPSFKVIRSVLEEHEAQGTRL